MHQLASIKPWNILTLLVSCRNTRIYRRAKVCTLQASSIHNKRCQYRCSIDNVVVDAIAVALMAMTVGAS